MAGVSDEVVIEAALNGGRERADHPDVPYTPVEVANEAARCAEAGASVVHIHARGPGGEWSADPAWYIETHRRIRERAPGLLISITSIRPAHIPISAILNMLTALSGDVSTRPDLISINLGHITVWEPVPTPDKASFRRRTAHLPNDYADIASLLVACRERNVCPELGVMDLGFVSNAVALRDGGLLPEPAWFLVELDSASYGAGPQVAPATTENYRALATPLRQQFPGATWAAHGRDGPGYAVLRRAMEDGMHVRVGFEDAIDLPDGRPAGSNADLVAWAVEMAREMGREAASSIATRRIVGCALERASP